MNSEENRLGTENNHSSFNMEDVAKTEPIDKGTSSLRVKYHNDSLELDLSIRRRSSWFMLIASGIIMVSAIVFVFCSFTYLHENEHFIDTLPYIVGIFASMFFASLSMVGFLHGKTFNTDIHEKSTNNDKGIMLSSSQLEVFKDASSKIGEIYSEIKDIISKKDDK